MKPEVDNNGDKYYAYSLWYVDDIMVIHHDAPTQLKRLDKYFKLKPDKKDGTLSGELNMYLGTKLCYIKNKTGSWAWTMSFAKYDQEAVITCEKTLKE